MALPRHFCWTRFGTEAGEPMERILARKEAERRENGGVFLWGIGNAVGPSMAELVRRESEPEVVFSPIRGKPRQVDANPAQVVAWTAGRTLWGDRVELPTASVVTSRGAPNAQTSRHYALVCETAGPLSLEDAPEMIPSGHLRNLRTGRCVGASQVTAIVSVTAGHQGEDGALYPASIRANLVFPYALELIDPVMLPAALAPRSGAVQMWRTSVLAHIRESRVKSQCTKLAGRHPA